MLPLGFLDDFSLVLSHSPSSFAFLRKEVIQPQVLLRLPCYDFTLIICPTLGGWLLKGYPTDFGCYKLSWCDGRCVQAVSYTHLAEEGKPKVEIPSGYGLLLGLDLLTERHGKAGQRV